MSTLLYFYGKECPHCEKMEKILDKIEENDGALFERLEVWHHKENMALLEELDSDEGCGGLPYYINTDTKKWLCGEVTEDEILDLIEGVTEKGDGL